MAHIVANSLNLHAFFMPKWRQNHSAIRPTSESQSCRLATAASQPTEDAFEELADVCGGERMAVVGKNQPPRRSRGASWWDGPASTPRGIDPFARLGLVAGPGPQADF